MIHYGENINPFAKNKWRARKLTEGDSQMTRKGSVRVHGLDSLDEAMAIKNILDEKGLHSAVTLNPGEFEYVVRAEGMDPFGFTIIIPIEFNLEEYRQKVNEAVIATDEMVEQIYQNIRNDPQTTLVAEELIKNIQCVRDYLSNAPAIKPQEENIMKNTPDTQSTNQETTVEEAQIISVVAAANNKTNDEVAAAVASHDTQSTASQPQPEESQATMNTNTNNATDATVTTTPAAAPKKDKLLGIKKKHLYIGAAVVAVAGLGFLGWKNADKIGNMFRKTSV